MAANPVISRSSAGIDLSARFQSTTTVAASPSGASETVIATLTLNPVSLALASGIWLSGWAAYTVGTNGVSVRLRIKQTNTSGSTVADTGVLNKTAASLYADDAQGIDASPPAGGVYVLTMIVASGSAASTVSSVVFTATIV